MWLRTDETNEAIKSLNKTHQFVLQIHEDAYNWKWVIIALHNSTQAFMVLALKGTASFNVCKYKGKFLDAMLSGDDYPELRMDNFLDLYKCASPFYVLLNFLFLSQEIFGSIPTMNSKRQVYPN
ncbi:MAG: hypothetical protein WBN94_11810 [Methanothrix sp.]